MIKRKIYLSLIQAFVIFSLMFSTGCDKDDNLDEQFDSTGAITVNITKDKHIPITNGDGNLCGTIGWTSLNDFNLETNNSSDNPTVTVSICNLGVMKSIRNIVNIPVSGYSEPFFSNSLVACEAKHGYVVKFEGEVLLKPIYVRLYVEELIANSMREVIGAKMTYIYSSDTTTLELSKDTLSYNAQGNTQSFAVTTNAPDWEYLINPYYYNWIKIVRNNDTLSVRTTANSSLFKRSGVITVVTNTQIFKNVIIEQAGRDSTQLILSQERLSFEQNGGSQNVTITTDALDWTYSCSESWLNISKNSNMLSISMNPNNSMVERVGRIAIQAIENKKIITVSQTGITTHSSAPYEVGDLFYKNGTSGMVYKVSDDGLHGMIVSLKEVSYYWSKSWNEHSVTGATDQSNGISNMNRIKQITGWESIYPAFKWCDDLNIGNVSDEKWYLPAINELNEFYAAYNVNSNQFDKALIHYGGNATDPNNPTYWSSSENSEGTAWSLYFGNGNRYNDWKHGSWRIRAVRTF